MGQEQLHQDIITHFTENQLRELSQEINVNYDYLAGLDLATRAKALIIYVERRNRLEALITAVVNRHPQLDPTTYQSEPPPPPDNNLSWIDNIATGGGTPIEEPPTWRWQKDDD